MVTQKNPFFKADKNDPYYRAVVANQSQIFWNVHAKESPDIINSLSESIKDLIFHLLQKDPIKRLSISEIIEHEWVQNDDKITKDDIKEEFTYALALIFLTSCSIYSKFYFIGRDLTPTTRRNSSLKSPPKKTTISTQMTSLPTITTEGLGMKKMTPCR